MGVPQCQREHPAGALEGAFDAPGCHRDQQHFGVRGAAEAGAARAQLFAQFTEIVDLAVERQNMAAVGGHHWLVAGGAEVDDRQPSMGSGVAGIGIVPVAVVVGAPVDECGTHGAHPRQQIPGLWVPGTRDAAHYRAPSPTSTTSTVWIRMMMSSMTLWFLT